jgi:hypothetical protein
MRTAGFVLVSALLVVACSKADPLTGTWNGTEKMTAREQAGIQDMPADLKANLNQTFANTKGTLTLNADGTCSESNNYHGGHSWTGKWTHQANTVTVALEGYETQSMTLGADGKTLTYRGWTYRKP